MFGRINNVSIFIHGRNQRNFVRDDIVNKKLSYTKLHAFICKLSNQKEKKDFAKCGVDKKERVILYHFLPVINATRENEIQLFFPAVKSEKAEPFFLYSVSKKTDMVKVKMTLLIMHTIIYLNLT